MTALRLEVLAIIASPFVVVWAWMARYRPKFPCWRCHGRKTVGSSKRWRRRKRCRRCDDTGELTVWGAGFMGGRKWDR